MEIPSDWISPDGSQELVRQHSSELIGTEAMAPAKRASSA
jgi:hypothetical protein